MPWWLGGIAASAKRQLQKARNVERERRLNDAYARGYRKYRQRQKQRKRRES